MKKIYNIFKTENLTFSSLILFSFFCVIILIYILQVTILDNQIEILEVTTEKKIKIIKVLDNVIYFINTYFHN